MEILQLLSLRMGSQSVGPQILKIPTGVTIMKNILTKCWKVFKEINWTYYILYDGQK